MARSILFTALVPITGLSIVFLLRVITNLSPQVGCCLVSEGLTADTLSQVSPSRLWFPASSNNSIIITRSTPFSLKHFSYYLTHWVFVWFVEFTGPVNTTKENKTSLFFLKCPVQWRYFIIGSQLSLLPPYCLFCFLLFLLLSQL